MTSGLQETDTERLFFATPAPNAIEWATRADMLNSPEIWQHFGCYEAMRDFFELLCPICKLPDDQQVWEIDTTNGRKKAKSREVLSSQPLLVWNATEQDDVCPRCRSTRHELIYDKRLRGYNQFHLVAGQRCLAPSSPVYTSRGLLTLDEMQGSESVIGYDGLPTSAAFKYPAVRKPAIKITTEYGFEQTCGEDHLVATIDENLQRVWKKAKDLTTDDVLVSSKGAELWGSKDVDLAQTRVLGYLIANGSVVSDQWVKFCDGDESIVQDFVHAVELGWGSKLSYYSAPKKHTWEFVRGNRQWVLQLRALGVTSSNALTKTVPRAVREGTREVVIEFIRAYMTCDGFAYVQSGGQGHKKAKVGYSSSSRQLADQVRLLLLNLGIRTSLTWDYAVKFNSRIKTTTPHYTVVVIQRDVAKFARLIGFNDASKTQTLQDCVALKLGQHDLTSVKGAGLFVYALYKQMRAQHGDSVPLWHTWRSTPTAKQSGLSPAHAAEFVACYKDFEHLYAREFQRIRQYADARWSPVAVKSIEILGEQDMVDLHVPHGNAYVANGLLNHNSGKSVLAGTYLGTYIEHRVLTLAHGHPKSLQGYFGDIAGSPYEITFLAASAVQSLDSIYAKFRNSRAASPWIQRYVQWIKRQERAQTTPEGMARWEYSETTSRVTHGLLNLTINSMNSNSHTSRGRTRIFSALDELSYMKSGDGQFSSEEIYRAQENSLMTIRGFAQDRMLLPWLGSITSVSSPKASDDYSMQMLRTAKDVPRMYAMHRATWDFSHTQPRVNFDELYRKDPISWRTNFAADPPATESPLVPDWDRFVRSVELNEKHKPTARFKTAVENMNGHKFIKMLYDYAEWDEAPHVICMDAGANFDAFALACAHREESNDGESITRFDWVYRIVPGVGEEVFFSSIVPVLDTLAHRQRVMIVRMDRWQSLQVVQDIRALPHNISAQIESISDQVMIDFMRDAFLGRVRMLPQSREAREGMLLPEDMSAPDVAYHEFQKLQRDPRGKVFNPDKGKIRGRNSDDVARCMAHCHSIVKNMDYVERETDTSRESRVKRSREGMAAWSQADAGRVFNPTSFGGRGRGW